MVDKLDPNRFLQYRLYRDSCVKDNGQYIKDLSLLNRPLEKVILLESTAAKAPRQEDNILLVPKWEGQMPDTTLLDLVRLFTVMGQNHSNLLDLRPILKAINQVGFQNHAACEAILRRATMETQKLMKEIAAQQQRRR